MRITEQYFWNFILGLFFLILTSMGAIILETEARVAWAELTTLDVALIILATWRITQLLTTDYHTKWLREQFLDLKKSGKGFVLERPKYGIRRALSDLFNSPWRMSLIVAGLVVFCFLLTTYTYYLLALLAVSAIASLLQVVTLRLVEAEEREG